jgi:hypothetical protein
MKETSAPSSLERYVGTGALAIAVEAQDELEGGWVRR